MEETSRDHGTEEGAIVPVNSSTPPHVNQMPVPGMIVVDGALLQSLIEMNDKLRKELERIDEKCTSLVVRVDQLTLAINIKSQHAINLQKSYDLLCANNHVTFAFFPLLPLEIRGMIWSFALARPRVVEIRYAYASNSYPALDARSPSPTHPLLAVNKHSRAEALKVLFPFQKKQEGIGRQSFYVNPRIDTIWFTHTEFWGSPWLLPTHGFPKNVGFPEVALSVVNLIVMISHDNTARTMEVMKKCYHGGVRKLKIVIVDEVSDKPSAAEFCPPSKPPLTILMNGTMMEKFRAAMPFNWRGPSTWELLAEDVAGIIENRRQEEENYRNLLLANVGSLEDVYELCPRLRHCSGWSPPIFEFVQAKRKGGPATFRK